MHKRLFCMPIRADSLCFHSGVPCNFWSNFDAFFDLVMCWRFDLQLEATDAIGYIDKVFSYARPERFELPTTWFEGMFSESPFSLVLQALARACVCHAAHPSPAVSC